MRCSRRRFLHDSALIAGASLAVPALDPGRLLSAAVPAARVAVVRRPGVTLGDGRLREAVVREMVWRAVQDATGLGSAADAFASLFGPDDIVGIKVNCLAGRRMSTSPAVALALAEGLERGGVRPHNVVIWERSSRELERAGYRVQKDRFARRVLGTDGDYEAEPVDAGSVGGCLSRLVTRTCTAQISAPVLKDHDLAGISGGLKNWYGAIHNPNKYHDHNCSPYVADLSALSPLRQRTRLVVCDALYAQCHGGPAHAPEFVWRHEAVLASTDPLALDVVGASILDGQRRRRGLPSLAEAGRPLRWVAPAVAHGLGVGSLSQIGIVES